jgi:hypothetical protein
MQLLPHGRHEACQMDRHRGIRVLRRHIHHCVCITASAGSLWGLRGSGCWSVRLHGACPVGCQLDDVVHLRCGGSAVYTRGEAGGQRMGTHGRQQMRACSTAFQHVMGRGVCSATWPQRCRWLPAL